MLRSFIFLSLLLQSLFALPLTSTPYYIHSAYMGNCIVSTNRGHGATVVTTPELIGGACPGNTVVKIGPHSNGYKVSGQHGLFIKPSKNGQKLEWDRKPFAWQFLSVGAGFYLIKGHNDRAWLDDPRDPKIVDLVKATSPEALEYYWILDIA